MTTYSDLITLLLTFFVALYAFSRIDVARFRQVATSLRSSLGVNLDRLGGLPDLTESPWLLKEAREREQLEQVLQRLRQTLPQEGSGISLVEEERGLVVRFADQVLFDTGKADIRPEAEPVLRRLAEILRPLENPLRVEGHTDSLPINTLQFPSNWELSTARASRVVRFFIEQGIPSERLSAAGYADQRPVASNSTAAGRAKNRRVDVVVLSLSELSKEPPLP
ncbi:MAG: OmpA family protein [Limnochordales bacterium]|nr:OmpA family protein [Limnochordales bacterium]